MYGYTPPPIPIVRPPRKRPPRKWMILYFCAVGVTLAVVLFALFNVLGTNTPGQAAHVLPTVTTQRTTTLASSSTPTITPTSTPTTRPTAPPAVSQPTPRPTTKPTPKPPSYHSCTASNCSNPWGFVLGCSCGNMWQQVMIAPSGFCSWFHCVPNFNAATGTIGECGNNEMAHNCAGYGGIVGYLYKYVPVTPTPVK